MKNQHLSDTELRAIRDDTLSVEESARVDYHLWADGDNCIGCRSRYEEILQETERWPRGTMVGGKYRIDDDGSEGGQGVVYKACWVELKRDVALKTISPERLRYFRTEAQTLASLTHQNIVPIWDWGEHEGTPYFVMEYLSGGKLRGDSLTPEEAAKIVEVLAHAVHFAHARTGKKVIHRDLKPANVLRSENGEPKITDYGLAIVLGISGSHANVYGARSGTHGYRAPEQIQGEADKIDERTDVYGLSATLYDLLNGHPPDLPSHSDLLEKVVKGRIWSKGRMPYVLEAICRKGLSWQREDRYQTAAELEEDLRRFRKCELTIAWPTRGLRRTLERVRLWRLRNKSTFIAIFLLILVSVISTWLAIQYWNLAESEVQARRRADKQTSLALIAEEKANKGFARVLAMYGVLGDVVSGNVRAGTKRKGLPIPLEAIKHLEDAGLEMNLDLQEFSSDYYKFAVAYDAEKYEEAFQHLKSGAKKLDSDTKYALKEPVRKMRAALWDFINGEARLNGIKLLRRLQESVKKEENLEAKTSYNELIHVVEEVEWTFASWGAADPTRGGDEAVIDHGEFYILIGGGFAVYDKVFKPTDTSATRTSFERAAKLLRPVAAKDELARYLLCKSLFQLGQYHAIRGEHQLQRQNDSDAVTLCDGITAHAADLTQSQWRAYLRMSIHECTFDAALGWLEKGLSLLRDAPLDVQKQVEHSEAIKSTEEFRDSLIRSKKENDEFLGIMMMEILKAENAIALKRVLDSFKTELMQMDSPFRVYEGSRQLALAADAVANIGPQRHEVTFECADHALGTLRQAVRCGCANIEQIKSDTAFIIIREARPKEFASLIKEIQAK